MVLLPGFDQAEIADPPTFRNSINLRVEVFDTRAGLYDGAGIDQVTFRIVADDGEGDVVWEKVETTAPYCVFGGNDPGCTPIDLRDGARYAQGHVAGAVHHQFDDFLRAVVVEGAYDEHRRTGREVVLVCDTGHMSRVAGEILVEDEGFANVVNLRGGMHRWQRWQAERRHDRTGCCGGVGMPACCPASSRSTSRT